MEFVSFDLLFILVCVAMIAGCVDTLAGGGGLITVPALLMSGMPPLLALGTNKLQASMGTATATFMMIRYRRITWMEVAPLMGLAFIGSAMGTIAVQFLDKETLSFIIPMVLLLILGYFTFARGLSTPAKPSRFKSGLHRWVAVPMIGGYDGMFGPGTGSFFSLAGVALASKTLIQATAEAKSFNFATNIASLLMFVYFDQVSWVVGCTMMTGQWLGASLGSRLLHKINASKLRLLVIIISTTMLLKYLYDTLLQA
ncbi:MAG: TSUP family transporter [Pontibacterium sp.]